MDPERLKEVLADEEFVKDLVAMEEPEQVQDALEDKGVPVTTDEILRIRDLMKKLESGEISMEKVEAAANGELSEEELEEVAGGIVVEMLAGIVFGITMYSLVNLIKRDNW